MKQPSKKAMYRLTYSRAVVTVGRLHAQRIADELEARLGPYAVDAELVKASILHDCDLLSQVTEELEAATTTVSCEETSDLLARSARNRLSSRLKKILVASRSRVRSELGEEALKLYRLNERTPESHEAIHHYAAEVLHLMEQHPRRTEDTFGNTFDTATLVAALRPAVDSYHAQLDQVMRELRKTQQARMLRDHAEERFRAVLVNVAAFVESRLRIAGLDALADRIRPTRARTSGAVTVELPAARTDPPLAQSA